MRSAWASPVPNTTCVRPCDSRQRVQPATWRPKASSSPSSVGVSTGGAGGAGPAESVLRRTGPRIRGRESRAAPGPGGRLAPAGAAGGEGALSAAATGTTATAATSTVGRLLGGAGCCEDRELLPHVRGVAVRAVGLLAVPDEL